MNHGNKAALRRCCLDGAKGRVIYYRSNDFDLSENTLVFLHGLTGNHSMFEPQFSFFSGKCNIIAWDAPAHGESRPYSHFSYENAAKDLKKILDECKVNKAVLIGQSMGGYISQSFICRYPDMVKGFVSIDSTPYGDYYSRSDIWWLMKIERLSKLFPEKLLKYAIAYQNSLTNAGRANMLAMTAGYNKSELCRLMGIAYADFLKDNRNISKFPCPVILLVGKKDTTGKVKAYNREWTKRSGYPLIWVPDAAHNSNVDNPAFVNKVISRFVAKL